jgi:hypothetical protein
MLADNAHVPELLKLPLLSLVRITVPIGVVGAVDVSVTLAVHVVGDPVLTVFGEQETLVLVEFSTAGVTVTVVVP